VASCGWNWRQLFEVAGVGHHRGQLFERVELVHGLIMRVGFDGAAHGMRKGFGFLKFYGNLITWTNTVSLHWQPTPSTKPDILTKPVIAPEPSRHDGTKLPYLYLLF